MKPSLLEAHFAQFLELQQLNDQKLLLMVSGGVDSMVLLHVAHQVAASENLIVFHLDHAARLDSAEDMNFVQEICSKMGVKFFTEKISALPSGNQESNWRKLRQKHSTKIAQAEGAQKILTAHHATDLVETMIFRLTKGAGPNGLAPFDTSTKPFWQISKTDLLAYAETHQLAWREDPTNQSLSLQRNMIRHEILPVLRKITPNLEKVFVRESTLFAQVDDFLKQSVPTNDTPVPLPTFLSWHPVLQKTWCYHYSNTPPSLSEIEDCLRWLHHDPAGNTSKTLGSNTLHYKNGQITLQ